MIKTVSINLSGQVFQMDENAYERLKEYLDLLQKHFEYTEGKEEIIADIENRIAEIFLEQIKSPQYSISLKMVNKAISAMGYPEQFGQREWQPGAAEPHRAAKRLFRDPDDKIIGGVCSGLSAYFGLKDPLWVRIAFVILLFISFGTAFWLYLILMILIPKAKTTSEKLQMRGEPVTIENLEKTMREDLHDLKKKLQNIKNHNSSRLENVLRRIFDFLKDVFLLGANAVKKAVAVLLLFVGILVIAGIVLLLFVLASWGDLAFPAIYQLIFDRWIHGAIACIGLLLLVGVPAFFFTYSGISILLGRYSRLHRLGISTVGLWFAGWIMIFYASYVVSTGFSVSETQKNRQGWENVSDTLHISVNSLNERNVQYLLTMNMDSDFLLAQQDDTTICMSQIVVDIRKSPDSFYMLEIHKSARGRNRKEATQRAHSIQFLYHFRADTLQVADYFTFPARQKYRGQQVKLILWVPTDKYIHLPADVGLLHADFSEIAAKWPVDMTTPYWKMTESGLICLGELSNIADTDNASISYKLGRFEEIQIDGNLDVEIKQGNEYSFIVKGNDAFRRTLHAVIEENRLIVSSELKWKDTWAAPGKARLYITAPTVRIIKINGMNKVNATNLETDHLTVEINGASRNSFALKVNQLSIRLDGASRATLRGSAHQARFKISGASAIDAHMFEIQRGTFDLSGASKAKAFVTEKLYATLSGASKLEYCGDARVISEVTGGSSLIRNDP